MQQKRARPPVSISHFYCGPHAGTSVWAHQQRRLLCSRAAGDVEAGRVAAASLRAVSTEQLSYGTLIPGFPGGYGACLLSMRNHGAAGGAGAPEVWTRSGSRRSPPAPPELSAPGPGHCRFCHARVPLPCLRGPAPCPSPPTSPPVPAAPPVGRASASDVCHQSQTLLEARGCLTCLSPSLALF